MSLAEILPPNLVADPFIAALIPVFDEEFHLLVADTAKILLLADLANQPAAVLDELAWQFRVELYDQSLTLTQKRELIAGALYWHSVRGTPHAVERMIDVVFTAGSVEEWFDYAGDPFHFRARVAGGQFPDAEKFTTFVRLAGLVKRASAILEAVVVEQSGQQSLYLGGAMQIGQTITIGNALGTWWRRITAAAALDVQYFDLSKAGAGFWSRVRSDGGDIRVTTLDGAQLPREVVGFNAVAHTGSLFIGAGGATAFYLYCGSGAAEPAANSTYGKYATWPSEYKTVWHGADYNDSTSTQNNGTQTGMLAIGAGKVGNAWNDGGAGRVDAADVVALHGATKATVSLWFKVNSFGAVQAFLTKWAAAQATFGLQTREGVGDGLQVYLATSPSDDGSGCYVVTGSGVIPSQGVYHHCVLVFDGAQTGDANRLKLYVDGAPVALSTQSGAVPAALTSGTAVLRAGASGALTRYLDGGLDEIKIAVGVARDATWVAREYANQNNPDAHWTLGSEE